MRVFSAQGVQNTQKCIEEDKNTDIYNNKHSPFLGNPSGKDRKLCFYTEAKKLKIIKMFKKLMLENHELVVKYKNTIQRIHL